MRILLVEDDTILAEAAAEFMRRGEFAVDRVDTIAQALHVLDAEKYDAIVLDLGLPDGDGYEVVRVLRRRALSVPVLILTARDAVEDRVQGLDLGADDYVVKPIAMTELLARLRALIRRSAGWADSRLSLGSLVLDVAGRRAYVRGSTLELSAREWAVLEYLMTHALRIVSKNQLIQAISSLGQELSENAIEAYVHRLRGKIENAGVVIRTVRGLGYLLETGNEC